MEELADDDDILYLNRQDVEMACGRVNPVAVVSNILILHALGKTNLPNESYLTWKNGQGESLRSINMPSFIGSVVDVAGTKVINANPSNWKRGIPRASGVTILFDTITARIFCIMEGALISSLRTAAVTALAASLLKSRPIECVAIIGAGVLGETHLKLLPKYLPEMRQVVLFDLEQDRAFELKERITSFLEPLGIVVEVKESAEVAIRQAHLVVPVTTTTFSYIHFDWLKPGTLVVNLSLDDLLPEVILKADKVIVDDWHLVRNDSRRLVGKMYRDGLINGPDKCGENQDKNRRTIDAEIGEILIGKKLGRLRKEEIIVVNPFGLSIEDIGLAFKVYQEAKKMNLGIYLNS